MMMRIAMRILGTVYQGAFSALNVLVFFITMNVSLVSCTPGESEKKYRIGFSQCTGDDSWRATMLAGIKREMAFHPGSDLIYKDAKDNNELQKEQVRELMSQGIDLLMISPNEAQPLTHVVEEAFNKGIPVIVIDRQTSSKLYTSFVGANNFEIGRMAAEYVARTLHNNGKVIEVIGRSGSTPAIERERGFVTTLQKYPGITITAQVYGNWLKEDAEAEMIKIKDKLSAADLVFAHNDMMALGAYEIYKKEGIRKKIQFIGVDGLTGPGGGMQLVDDKVLNATLLYPTGGEEAVQTAFKILNGESFQKENILQTLVIDSTNVRSLLLQAEKINTQQKDIEKQQSLLERQRAIYKSQTILLEVTISALILVLVLGIITLLSLRHNRRINKRLSASNEEILLQRNQVVEMTAKAREATEAKLNFFTNISHELRTPLTLILGPLEDALTQPKLHFSLKYDLTMVHKNALRLLRLVNQLMDFGKLEHSKMKLKASENDLVEFVTDITNAFRELAIKRHIKLDVQSRLKSLAVWFDVNMLDKVLFNLLSNAFKFTRENGYVTVNVSISPDGKYAVIEVEDDGIGMTPEAVEHAFELFYQEQGTTFKGTGLGLALSKQLIELHMGSIGVRSEKWKGTIFEVYLPIGKEHLSPDEMVEKAPLPTMQYEDIDAYVADKPILPPTQTEITSVTKEYSILLIEDSDDMRSFLKHFLSPHFEVYEAINSQTGISMTYEMVPDLILCDLALPGNDGLYITETLKADIRSSHIPIIILTANNSVEKQIASMKLKADAFVAKPFNLQHLEETIKSLLKNRRILREHYTSEAPLELKAGAPAKMDRKFINEFTAIVEKNIGNENFSVEDICRETGVSRVQLNRKIKALLGVNVNDYILNARLQKAKYLLCNEDLSIGEVASQVGFASQTYFSTVFKSKVFITPSEFKEKAKG